MKTKIIFFGSDKYSQIVFKSLQEDNRWQIVKSLKAKPKVGVLASYGKILTKETLGAFPHGILNIHPSLLPKYRGASPVQTAILEGEKETGVTIIKMDEEVDHGLIVVQFKEEIRPDDTSESLYKRLFTAGAQVLKTILPVYLEGKIKLRKQNHSQATFTQKLTRDSGKIDWQKPADYSERFIRAMHSWPGAWTEIQLKKKDKKRLKILKAHLEDKKLVFDQVQLEGKNPVAWKQFQEGYPEVKIVNFS
jgi:methionyl-tRNA formyltransferase